MHPTRVLDDTARFATELDTVGSVMQESRIRGRESLHVLVLPTPPHANLGR